MASNARLVIQQNADLQPLNTLAVPARARWFGTVASECQLREALQFSRREQCPIRILGGGSNVVLSDYFDGLVLHIQLKGRELIENNAQDVVVVCSAGENWHDTVMWAVAQGYGGIENLALIPGSVGAAPIQNIGAYGVELESVFEYLEAIDIRSGEPLVLHHKDCEFAYRDSIFKRDVFKQDRQDQLIITKVALRLQKQPTLVLSYPALAQALAAKAIEPLSPKQPSPKQLTPKQVAETVIAIRQSKLPDPASIPNAGSFFKNPIIDAATHEQLQASYPQLVSYPLTNGHYKLAAGWLLDQAGWKGRPYNGLLMHQDQALVLTNPDRRSAEDIMAFAETVVASIQQTFGVHLDIEPRVFV